MRVAFFTMGCVHGIESRGLYTDLMRMFRDNGHEVYIISPRERKYNEHTSLKKVDGVNVLGVKTLNIQKTNIIEKGIGTILLGTQVKSAVKHYFKNIKFDLILYSTPPITFNAPIQYLKRKNSSAISYLLLKDIFPQNAVDLGMFSKRSLFYKYFRSKEKKLYQLSDFIGCMSPANVEFLVDHNPYLNREHIEIAPNNITLVSKNTILNAQTIRAKYNLPLDKPIFIYGGNLGKPQGIDFLVQCLQDNKNRSDCYFVIVGNGTDYYKISNWMEVNRPNNISLFKSLPQSDYDSLVSACDVGLIFLDHRFTIPNFPSRLLSYMENHMPVITATDTNTDVGTIAESNNFGFRCESVKPEDFTQCVDQFLENKELSKTMGDNAYNYLLKNYQTDNTYNVIMSHFK